MLIVLIAIVGSKDLFGSFVRVNLKRLPLLLLSSLNLWVLCLHTQPNRSFVKKAFSLWMDVLCGAFILGRLVLIRTVACLNSIRCFTTLIKWHLLHRYNWVFPHGSNCFNTLYDLNVIIATPTTWIDSFLAFHVEHWWVVPFQTSSPDIRPFELKY